MAEDQRVALRERAALGRARGRERRGFGPNGVRVPQGVALRVAPLGPEVRPRRLVGVQPVRDHVLCELVLARRASGDGLWDHLDARDLRAVRQDALKVRVGRGSGPRRARCRDQGGVVSVGLPHVVLSKGASAVRRYVVVHLFLQVEEDAMVYAVAPGVYPRRDRVAHQRVAVILARALAHAIRRRFDKLAQVDGQLGVVAIVDGLAVPRHAPVKVLVVLLRRVGAAGVGGGQGVRGGV